MSSDYIVYGATGSGSVPIEAALQLIGQSYRTEEHTLLDPWVVEMLIRYRYR